MLEPVLAAAWQGWWQVFSWPNIIYPIAGTLLAMIFSVLPGLSGITLMALAIPLTIAWEPLPVMLLFGAFVGGATFAGSITAILFNIPGRTSNAATLFDGYPLAQEGKARTAIGCSATASALGATFGLVVLVLLIPLLRRTLLLFGPPEILMLSVWGLTTLAVLTRGSRLTGLGAAGLGLLLAFVGDDPRMAEPRYTVGTLYLSEGLGLIPVFVGLFAFAELLDLSGSHRPTISGKRRVEELTGSLWQGARSVFRHFGLFLRCSVIGTVVGMIPGVGAVVASFVAYGHAASSGEGGRFGHGDIRGVLAPEAANDAKDGGALVPTLAFGIPGGTGTAMLLAALTLHGLRPGVEMMTTHLNLVFVLIWSLFLSNWLTSLLGLAAVKPLSKLTLVRTQVLVPGLFVLALLGAHLFRGRLEDVVAATVFGLIGWGMKRFDWPRVPLVIGLVLGSVFETNLYLTQQLHQVGRINFWIEPIAMGLLGLTVVSLSRPFLRERSGRSHPALHPPEYTGWERVAFSGGLLVVAAIFLGLTLELGAVARAVPLFVVVPTVLLVGSQVVVDTTTYLGAVERNDPHPSRRGAAVTALWLVGTVASIYLVGLLVTVPMYVLLYLRLRAREGWRFCGAAAAGLGGGVYGVVVHVLGMPLHEGVLVSALARALRAVTAG